MVVLSRALLALALACAGCVFAPQLGDGTLGCGDGGSCPPGQSCAADGVCRVYPAPPADAQPAPGDLAPCAPVEIDCKHAPSGGHRCGLVPNGCGGTVDCGRCGGDQTCGRLTANVCG